VVVNFGVNQAHGQGDFKNQQDYLRISQNYSIYADDIVHCQICSYELKFEKF
jgi:hypothetical protein